MIPYANFERREQKQLAGGGVPLAEGPTYLRLARRGNQLIGSVSGDGKKWETIRPMPVALGAKVKVGVAALNTSSVPFTVRLERFLVRKAPGGGG